MENIQYLVSSVQDTLQDPLHLLGTWTEAVVHHAAGPPSDSSPSTCGSPYIRILALLPLGQRGSVVLAACPKSLTGTRILQRGCKIAAYRAARIRAWKRRNVRSVWKRGQGGMTKALELIFLLSSVIPRHSKRLVLLVCSL